MSEYDDFLRDIEFLFDYWSERLVKRKGTEYLEALFGICDVIRRFENMRLGDKSVI